MKREGVRTFKSRLREELKDPEFKRHYDEERQALKLAIKIAALRKKVSTGTGEADGNQPAGDLADRKRRV